MSRILFSLKNASRKRILILALLVNALFFGVFFLWMNPAFETNDDIGMMLTSSGVRTGQPSEYLTFPNILIGTTLKFLYRHTTGINWYPIYLISIHFLAMVLILYSIVTLRRRWLSVLQYILVFIFFEYPLLLRLQFTSTAIVTGIGGVCIFLTSLRRTTWESWLYFGMAILGIVTAGLIREKVAYLVIVFAAPVLVMLFRESKTYKIPVFLIASLSILFLCIRYDRSYYSRDPAWREFIEYNTIRGQLHDYPKLTFNEQTKPVFEKIGWDENDFLMFHHRFFSDRIVYSKEKLAFVNDTLRNSRSVRDTLAIIVVRTMENAVPVIVTFFFLLLSLIWTPGNQRRVIYIVAMTAMVLCIYFAYSARLPFRIYFPMVFFVNALCIVFNGDFPYSKITQGSKKRRYFTYAAVVLLVVFLLPVQLWIIHSTGTTNLKKNSQLRKELQLLSPGQDNLYVVWGADAITFSGTSPFSDLSEFANRNFVFSGRLNDPHGEPILRRLGIDNVYLAFEECRHIFLVMNDNGEYPEMLKQFILRHYRKKVELRLLNRRGGMGIYTLGEVG